MWKKCCQICVCMSYYIPSYPPSKSLLSMLTFQELSQCLEQVSYLLPELREEHDWLTNTICSRLAKGNLIVFCLACVLNWVSVTGLSWLGLAFFSFPDKWGWSLLQCPVTVLYFALEVEGTAFCHFPNRRDKGRAEQMERRFPVGVIRNCRTKISF